MKCHALSRKVTRDVTPLVTGMSHDQHLTSPLYLGVQVVCGSSLAEESIHRYGLHRAPVQRMDGPQAAGFTGGF